MLTVLNISPSGNEILRQAHAVGFEILSEPDTDVAKGKKIPTVFVFAQGGDIEAQYTNGWTYVMNDNGKTVATYKLNDRD